MAGALPRLADYQKRTCEGTAIAVTRRKEDVLVEAPTGSGKTAMIGRTARPIARNGGKVLVLTHRKTLFAQMAGNPEAHDEKARAGEIAWWGGIAPGSIADPSLGGENQEPSVVIGMVETVAGRLDQLDNYTVIMIDEVHHASRDSADRDALGAYARIIEACPEARIIGYTATSFRGDGDRLHPRLEAAHREVVGIEEARTAQRIVKARTILGKAPLEDGRRPADLAREEISGDLDRSASAIARDSRGNAFYDHTVEDWERLVSRRKTIVFADSIEEVDDITRRFNDRYGEGVAVPVHGRRSAKENSTALTDYREDRADVMVACQMIGEGFDVPKTDAVMSLNASLSRQEMNQYVGRTIRAADGKSEGLFVDYGTASIRHGLIEHQHELQNVDALAAAGSRISAARVIGRMAPRAHDTWRVVPGERRSLFLRRNAAKYELYDLDHRAERDMGRRTGKAASSVGRLTRYEHPEKGRALLGPIEVARVLADHGREEAGYIARSGGLGGDAYAARCESELDHWKGSLDVISRAGDMPRKDLAARQRSSVLQECLAGARKGHLIRRTLESASSGMDLVREGLSLSGEILSHCERDEKLPLGLRSEARVVLDRLDGEDWQKASPGRLRKEARAMSGFLDGFAPGGVDDDLGALARHISEPLAAGSTRIEREMRRGRMLQAPTA